MVLPPRTMGPLSISFQVAGMAFAIQNLPSLGGGLRRPQRLRQSQPAAHHRQPGLRVEQQSETLCGSNHSTKPDSIRFATLVKEPPTARVPFRRTCREYTSPVSLATLRETESKPFHSIQQAIPVVAEPTEAAGIHLQSGFRLLQQGEGMDDFGSRGWIDSGTYPLPLDPIPPRDGVDSSRYCDPIRRSLGHRLHPVFGRNPPWTKPGPWIRLAGLRITKPRLALIDALQRHPGPVSIERIHQEAGGRPVRSRHCLPLPGGL